MLGSAGLRCIESYISAAVLDCGTVIEAGVIM